MSRRSKWNERYAAKALVWSAGPNALLEKELGKSLEEVAGSRPRTAFDAACGEGRNALWLAEQGWQVTAADFSDVGIDKGRRTAEHRGLVLNWLVADLARDTLPDQQYDLVTVLYLHTDSSERARWLPRLIDRVAPGGTFFYLGHDPANVDEGVGGPQDPDLLPSADEIVGALADFEIVAARVEARPVDADPGHGQTGDAGVALDTYVRAIRRR